MSQLVLKELTRIFTVDSQHITAVKTVSLAVARGEFLSIVGHSGSGKTTLLSMIGGIVKPTSGSIVFEGTDISVFDDRTLAAYRNRKIGFMFQFSSLLPILTVKENLLLPCLFSGSGNADAENRAGEYLDLVGLKDKLTAYPAQLSGGQQRRVAIARSLMNRPALILADEPTGDLDEETEAEMMELFTRINREQGITFIMVTHSTGLAKQTRRRLSMSHGVLREHPEGTSQ